MRIAGWRYSGLLKCCVATLQAMVDDSVEVDAGQVIRCYRCKTAMVVSPGKAPLESEGIVSWVRTMELVEPLPESAA